VYCPKLCRAACPVSNVEANETVTPWGKMSVAYFEARGDVPLDREHAATAWACTGCFACRERCDHKNPVAPVLVEARAEAFSHGVAPPEAAAVSAGWPERARTLAYDVEVLATQTDTDRAAPTETALLVGCGYVRRAPEVARDAVHATSALTRGKVRPVRACCGLPLLHAGDRAGFAAAAGRFAAEVAQAKRLVAVDPGCARTLLVEYARIGVRLPETSLFVDIAAAERARLRPLPDLSATSASDPAERSHLHAVSNLSAPSDAATAERSHLRSVPDHPTSSDAAATTPPVRWHDPCQLGRGLGRYDEPRAVLERLVTDVASFPRDRAMGECSGGGGLLPLTRPETSRAIADERIAEHHRKGGGVLVTHCASSLHRFRSRGEPAVDLTTLIARALRP